MIIDMRGRPCPAPIIALGKKARQHPGLTVELIADDPAAAFDVPAWCRMTGGEMLAADHDPEYDSARYVVRLPGEPRTGGSASNSGSSAS